MIRKIIVFLTSVFLALISILASAATIGAWTVSNPMAVGAFMLYDGSKGAVTSSVLITPNASQVAKVLRGGAAGYALTLAVEQLLGAVDWVLDPANNQIRYHPIPEGENPNIPKFWVITDPFINPQKIGYSTPEAMCRSVVGKKLWASSPVTATVKIEYSNSLSAGCLAYTNTGALFASIYISYITNPDYDPNKEKTLPLETVAQKVIENAENNNLDAQFAILAAANNILSEAENDQAKAKPIEDALEENKNNTCNPPAGVKFNKVTHYESHSEDPLKGTHGCMASTGSPIHWHYSVNHQSPNGRCFLAKHVFGGCGVAP